MIMIRRKCFKNRNPTNNWPYQRRQSAEEPFEYRRENPTTMTPKLMPEPTTADGTDLSVMNQLLTQQKMYSTFDLIESKGPPHSPIFTMLLSIRNQSDEIIAQVTASDRTKKSAKQAAAKEYMCSIIPKYANVTNNNNSDKIVSKEKQVICTDFEENVIGNAVGALEDFCRVNGLSKPMYEFKLMNPAPTTSFQCDCSVNNVMCSGMGSRKKVAKHNAANMVLMKLQSADTLHVNNVTCASQSTDAGNMSTRFDATDGPEQSAKHSVENHIQSTDDFFKTYSTPNQPVSVTDETPPSIRVANFAAEKSEHSAGDAENSPDILPQTPIKAEKVDGPEVSRDSVEEIIDKYYLRMHSIATEIQENDFVVLKDVVTPDAEQKLASVVKRFMEIYADDMQCTPAEYLTVVNLWRHPSDMTQLLEFWITSTLVCKMNKYFETEMENLGIAVLRSNDSLITETNPHVMTSFYEFCVWTPLILGDNCTDYFMFSSMDSSGNFTVRKHYPKVGESIVCHHSVKYRFRGDKQQSRSHFYLCTEWKRSTYFELDSIDRFISIDVPPLSNCQIRNTMLHGLRSICGKEFNFNLMQCTREWQRQIRSKDFPNIERMLKVNRVDVERLKQTLSKFILTQEANECHNAFDFADHILQELSEQLLKPIEQFVPKKEK